MNTLMKLARIPAARWRESLAREHLAFLLPQAIGLPVAPTSLEMDGANINPGALISTLAALSQNGAPFSGYCNFAAVSAASNFTFSATNVPGGLPGAVVRASGGAGVNGTLTTTDLLLATFGPNPYVGQSALFILANANTGTITLVAGDANTTLSGTTTALTVNTRMYQILVTNLAIPGAPGAASTNTTTTTAAVAAGTPSLTSTTCVIPVTASTGMLTTGSVLQVTQVDGSFFVGSISAINSLNITLNGVNTKAIASGAAVAVWNPQVKVTGMFAWGTAGVIA